MQNKIQKKKTVGRALEIVLQMFLLQLHVFTKCLHKLVAYYTRIMIIKVDMFLFKISTYIPRSMMVGPPHASVREFRTKTKTSFQLALTSPPTHIQTVGGGDPFVLPPHHRATKPPLRKRESERV